MEDLGPGLPTGVDRPSENCRCCCQHWCGPGGLWLERQQWVAWALRTLKCTTQRLRVTSQEAKFRKLGKQEERISRVWLQHQGQVQEQILKQGCGGV